MLNILHQEPQKSTEAGAVDMKVNSSLLEASGTASKHVAMGVLFSLQTSVGMLGNLAMLFHYISLPFSGFKIRPTDVILKHLTTANTLVILSKGITQTMADLGVISFLDDLGCKLVFYFNKVGRGVSFGATCLLSVFQMVTISPWTSKWAQHKEKAFQNTEYYLFLIWILNMLLNILVAEKTGGNLSRKNTTRKKYFGYCSIAFQNEVTASLYAALLSLPDVLSLGLMLWASGSMVSMLYRHKLQVQHLHRAHVTPRAAPETRATHSILVLVSTFVTFYILSSVCHLCLSLSNTPSWWLVTLSVLCAASFPTISPFLLMNHHSRLWGPCCDHMRKTNIPSIIRRK